MGHSAEFSSRRARQRRPFSSSAPPAEATALVVLPHVVVTVAETGALDVTVDGAPFPPSPAVGAWTRGRLSDLLDAVTADRTGPVRVEVRESDGTVFTDIIRHRHPTGPRPATPEPETRRGRRSKKPKRALVEVAAGFVPGEDVAVAVIVTHTAAGDTGAVRALLDRHRLPAVDGKGEVLLYGRVSGTTVVRRVP